jgi:membrane-associated phospholipid phosphatase
MSCRSSQLICRKSARDSTTITMMTTDSTDDVTVPATRPKWLYVGLAGAMFLLGFVLLSVDLTAAAWFREVHDAVLWKPVKLAEIFAHGWGVALIGLCAISLARSPQEHLAVGWVIACGLLSGLAANLGKILIIRTRPSYWTDWPASVTETFQGWLPILGEKLGSSHQSCPSSHAATAGGMLVGLTWAYPQGRYFWLFAALLACFQRLVEGAHFPSDVCWGLGLGILIGNLILRAKPLSKF